jgi:hypothetical protein
MGSIPGEYDGIVIFELHAEWAWVCGWEFLST